MVTAAASEAQSRTLRRAGKEVGILPVNSGLELRTHLPRHEDSIVGDPAVERHRRPFRVTTTIGFDPLNMRRFHPSEQGANHSQQSVIRGNVSNLIAGAARFRT